MIQLESEGDLLVVCLDETSTMNGSDVKKLTDSLIELLSRANERSAIIDFRQAVFAESDTLGPLITLLRRCSGLGIDVRLCNFHSSYRDVFCICRLEKLLSLYPDVAAARRAIKEKQ